ncbi:cation:proton antiporter subunit C [bacterium]|nr:cation:proton antiporter subunit C [bacterium]
MTFFLERLPYLGTTALLLIGMWGLLVRQNLMKKVIALTIMQTAVFLFYVSAGFVEGGEIPIVLHGEVPSVPVAPLPHVLMLTAIVVGVATVGVALALLVRINADWGTIDETDLQDRMR